MANLSTDFKDEVLETNKYPTYNIVDSSGNVLYTNVRLVRTDTPKQIGTKFGAKEVNTINGRVNTISNAALFFNSIEE